MTGRAGSADSPPRPMPRPPGGWLVLAGVVLVAATPIAVWWLVGDLSTTAVPDPDYMIHPIPMGAAVERLLGSSAVLLVGVSGAVLLGATWRGRLPARWWGVLVPLLAAGAFCGAGWRVLTAGVVGANIGGGLVLLGGGPIVLTLIGVAVVVARSLGRPPRRPSSSA